MFFPTHLFIEKVVHLHLKPLLPKYLSKYKFHVTVIILIIYVIDLYFFTFK